MSWGETIDMLMVRAEIEEAQELPSTLAVARYIYDRPNLLGYFTADQLDKVREIWVGADGWFNGFQVADQCWANEHVQICNMIETADVYVKSPTLVVNSPLKMQTSLWDVVILLSDRATLMRIAAGIPHQNAHHLVHELFKLRFLCKRSLILIEFDPHTDPVATMQHF